MMKTAIIIIPEIGDGANPCLYLSECADKVKADGYTVLHSTYWNEYKDIDFHALIKRSIKGIDTFYFFVDYGICDLMIEIIRNVKRTNGKTHWCNKETRIEVFEVNKRFNLLAILKDVSNKENISMDLMKLKTHKREVAEARQIFFKRAKEITKCTLFQIGAVVNRDHSTVLHGIKVVNDVKELNQRYQKYFGNKKINHPKSLMEVKTDESFIPPFRNYPTRSCAFSGFREHSL